MPVTSGQTSTGINAALAADGAISGRVTAASGGARVSGVLVEIYLQSTCGAPDFPQGAHWFYSAVIVTVPFNQPTG